MAQKAWFWLKRKLFPVPHVRVPTAAFFTGVKAAVYAEQLTLLDAASFGCSDISELRLSLPEAEQSPDGVNFQHLSEWTVRTILAQSCPKRRALIVSHFIDIATILHQMRNVHSEAAILSALSSAPIERLKGTWSRVPKSRRRTFRTLWELLCCPHETDTDCPTSKMEKVFSSEPFHLSVSFDHLRVWPNIQHLLEPCHFSELDPVGMGTFTFMVSTELES
ncbi:ras-specific guanine nucleotide-releasing factor RalGPS2 [Trichonephila inaurata madagascariensis]|uniref:Ras-specific guanine nucleotide-releasing factor RalGPS2 n=1 Tax=Trichonephila inaurata madagascariensis TaxID=2747483 RepID=A0A8X6XUH6_9ARAC|nr:ras-specific guanine nucleotide-releasing factor RalGPS2 [Trichonephila inaurata madagascariensis]